MYNNNLVSNAGTNLMQLMLFAVELQLKVLPFIITLYTIFECFAMLLLSEGVFCMENCNGKPEMLLRMGKCGLFLEASICQ